MYNVKLIHFNVLFSRFRALIVIYFTSTYITKSSILLFLFYSIFFLLLLFKLSYSRIDSILIFVYSSLAFNTCMYFVNHLHNQNTGKFQNTVKFQNPLKSPCYQFIDTSVVGNLICKLDWVIRCQMFSQNFSMCFCECVFGGD